ncbi:MAG: hypothetical protein HY986_01575 [Candidatus Melainabacteria bacterium]|nr:hypothetical protein [Candidatus Melainabacteria bacterium]
MQSLERTREGVILPKREGSTTRLKIDREIDIGIPSQPLDVLTFFDV